MTDNPFTLEITGDVHYETTIRHYIAVPIQEGDEYGVFWDGDVIAWVTREDTDPRTYRIDEPPLPEQDATGWRNSRDALNAALESALTGTDGDIDQAREAIGY